METGKQIIPPEGGWKEHMVYEVEVAFSKNNVIHRSLFYSGFLNSDKTPGSYNHVWNPTYDNQIIENVYYLKVVREILLWPLCEGIVTPECLEKNNHETG